MLNDLIDNPIIRHYNSPHNLNIEKDLHCQTTENTREQPGIPSNLKRCKTVNRIWDTKARKHGIPHSPEGWSLRETVTEKRPRVVLSHFLERLSKWQRQESVEENQEASFWVEKQKFKQETVNQLTGSAAKRWKKECKSEEQDAQGAPVLVAESWSASPIVNPPQPCQAIHSYKGFMSQYDRNGNITITRGMRKNIQGYYTKWWGH